MSIQYENCPDTLFSVKYITCILNFLLIVAELHSMKDVHPAGNSSQEGKCNFDLLLFAQRDHRVTFCVVHQNQGQFFRDIWVFDYDIN